MWFPIFSSSYPLQTLTLLRFLIVVSFSIKSELLKMNYVWGCVVLVTPTWGFYFCLCSLKHLRWNKLSLHVEKNSFHRLWPGTLMADTDRCVLCRTGSTVRGEWGTAHIRADLHRRPSHAHEDRDDVARHVRPGLQDQSRAHRAGVGGASGTKSWEKRRTRQWNRVSQGRPGPQGGTDSRIIWL